MKRELVSAYNNLVELLKQHKNENDISFHYETGALLQVGEVNRCLEELKETIKGITRSDDKFFVSLV